jgi:protein arginine kinase activator
LQVTDEESADDDEKAQTLVCPACGHEESDLQSTGLLGCPQCYTTFRRRIVPLLRRYHREVHHLGKAPQAQGPRAALRRQVAALKAALEEAVSREEYERAAQLRDEIQAKEQARAAVGDEAPPATDDDTEE